MLRKIANFIDIKFLHVCVENTSNFVIKIWEMAEKIKTDVDRLLLVSKLENTSILAKYIQKCFLSKLKIVYLCPFLSSLSFPKF